MESSYDDKPISLSETITNQQMPLISPSCQLVDEILGLDISQMTPMEAINKLYELQNKACEAK